MIRGIQILLAIAFLNQGCATAADLVPPQITPCPDDARVTPVVKECAAAAIAESAFLKATKHAVAKYWIAARDHTDKQWRFVIVFGDRSIPSAPGNEYMAAVEKTTAEVKLSPGE